jgi:hypothetical protein
MFIFPLFIIIFFILGLQVKGKFKNGRSIGIIFISLFLVVLSWVILPILLFYINFKQVNIPVRNIEFITEEGEKTTIQNLKNKTSLIYFSSYKCNHRCTILNSISQVYNKDSNIQVLNVVFDSESNYFFNDTDTTKRFECFIDFNNKLSKQINISEVPAYAIIDKKSILKFIHSESYRYEGDYFKKQLLREINLLYNK